MYSFEILCVLILCGLGIVLAAPIEDNNAYPQGDTQSILEEVGTGVAAERFSRHLHRKKHQHYQVVDYHEPQPVAVVHRPQQSHHGGGGGGGSFAGSSAQAGSFGHNSQSQAASQSASFNYGPIQASISSSFASSNAGGGGYGGGYFDY